MKRDLTGIFIRAQVDSNKWGSWDISDLSWETVENWLTVRDADPQTDSNFVKSCVDRLVESLANLLTFIDNGNQVDPENVRKNLYGDPIQQCRQCLATLNMLADAVGISTREAEDTETVIEEVTEIIGEF